MNAVLIIVRQTEVVDFGETERLTDSIEKRTTECFVLRVRNGMKYKSGNKVLEKNSDCNTSKSNLNFKHSGRFIEKGDNHIDHMVLAFASIAASAGTSRIATTAR